MVENQPKKIEILPHAVNLRLKNQFCPQNIEGASGRYLRRRLNSQAEYSRKYKNQLEWAKGRSGFVSPCEKSGFFPLTLPRRLCRLRSHETDSLNQIVLCSFCLVPCYASFR